MDNVLHNDEPQAATAGAMLNAPEAPAAGREFIEEPAEPLNGALIVTGSDAPARPPGFFQRLRPAKMSDALWKSATLFSLAVNLILVVGLLVVGTQVFALKNGIVTPLVGGLYDNF